MSARAKSLLRKGEQLLLEFADNKLVAALSGPHQKHFARLEQRLSVLITQRGNLIALSGPSDARARVAAILRALYARLEAGESITLAEVDAEIRFTDPDSNGGRGMSEGAIRTATTRMTRPRSPAQSAYLDLMRNNPLVFGIGPAGTGKTYLAAAFGAHMLFQRRVERLILSRPALEAGERLGFLPGDLKEKIDPYLRPLYDALFDVLGEQTTRLMDQGVIEVAPLAFMRGRTLSRAFVILDEAQNTTPAQMKMMLTRLGEESQMVVTGDPSQSDLPGSIATGLNEALSILKDVEGIGVARFSDADVVRHALVSRVVAAYSAHGK
ncbi:MAG TPA: PhoH family protein [Rhizomicrobium sp.]|nr:PhoH family protein [Rhizomicrobium sp.]